MPETVALFRRRGLGDDHAVNLLIILDGTYKLPNRWVTRQLRGREWSVIRVWQHFLKKSPQRLPHPHPQSAQQLEGVRPLPLNSTPATLRQLAKRRIALVLSQRTWCLDPYLPEQLVWVMVHP